MARGLQLVQVTFSLGQPDPNEILGENSFGKDGSLKPKILRQGPRAKLEETWGSGYSNNAL
jgi:hypothetical protein